MITISTGLVNSLIVLELLRNNEELNDKCDISIGAFTNCRECGLTFTPFSYKDDEGEFVHTEPFTFCVYEHRNSDDIILNGKDGWISLNGHLPYQADSKSVYIASFPYSEHYKCAEKITELILEKRLVAIAKQLEKKTKP